MEVGSFVWLLDWCMCVCVSSAMRFGRVDTLGQYISEFDPEPDSGKKGIGIHTSLAFVVTSC